MLLAAALAAGTTFAPVQPAHAAGFFNALFGVRSPRETGYGRGYYRDQGYGNGQRGYGRGYYPPAPQSSEPAYTEPAPLPEAKTHEYFTYKPDAMEVVSLASLIDPVTTASVAQDGSAPMAADPFGEARAYLGDVSIRAVQGVGEAVKAYYSTNPHYIWVSGSSVNERAHSVLAVLQDAAAVGLDPADYKVDVPADSFDMADMASRQKELIRFEMNLSAAVLTYALDAKRGRIAPDRISDYYDLPRKKVDLKADLEQVATAGDAGEWLKGQNPQGKQFQDLKAELARLRAADVTPQVTVAEGTFVRPGGTSPEMPNIVKAIEAKASDTLKTDFADTLATYQQSEDYTPDLVKLVRAFQKEKGLSPDGIIGSGTVSALSSLTNAGKIERVVDAMEQARWLPGTLPAQRVFINEAAFEATYFENNEPKLVTKAIVGQTNHQTNFFSDQIETVEFNPYWGVPQSIIIREMLPKLRRDPTYLDRLGYQLQYKGKDVSSSEFNWNTISSTKAFSVRQPPGEDNALGQLKILFPNKHAIYMHDTPAKSLFKKQVRDFSHGCVRLQDPRGMAAAVLGISRDKVDQYIATGQNQGVSVPTKIPVFVAYFTAWPDATGTVHYYNDIYDRDTYLQRAIKATEAERHPESRETAQR